MNKKNVSILIIALLVIAGGSFIWKNNQKNKVGQQQNQIKNQEQEVNVNNWNAYDNSRYKYSFKHPDVIDVEVLGLGGGLADQNTKDIVLDIKENNEAIDLSDFKFIVSIFENYEKNASIKDIANEFVEYDLNNAKTIKIDGIESIRYIGGGKVKFGPSGSNSDIIITKHNGNVFIIITTNSEEGKNVLRKKESDLVQDILDSFDFK